MQINAPFSTLEELKAQIAAGATELYCGVNLSSGATMNRRPTAQGNFSSLNKLAEAVDFARSSNIPVNVVLNDLVYSDEQLQSAIRLVRWAASNGIRGVIVADPALAVEIAGFDTELRLYASTVAGVYNVGTANFWRSLGITRIILPRHLSLKEIGALVSALPDIEFEALVMGDPCQWDDSYCGFEHTACDHGGRMILKGGGCAQPYSLRLEQLYDDQELDLSRVHRKHQVQLTKEMLVERYTDFMAMRGCGLCALYDLNRLGVAVVKSASRDNQSLAIHNVVFVKAACRLLESRITRAEFVDGCRELRLQMHSDFVARNTLLIAHHNPDAAQLGHEIRNLVNESWLIECEPPHSCYYPELL